MQRFNVRLATDEDTPWIVDVAAKKMICEEMDHPSVYSRSDVEQVTKACMGTIWVVENYGVKVGVLGALPSRHPFNSQIKTLVELIWFVDRDFRSTRVGFLLLKAFLSQSENYDILTLSTLPTSNVKNSSLSKLGFELKELGYIKGV